VGSRAQALRNGPTGMERCARYRFLCAAFAVFALAIMAGTPAAHASPRNSPTPPLKPGAVKSNFSECQPIKGPEWMWPQDNFPESDLYHAKISSTLYESFVVNYDCTKARSAIEKLINETLPNTTPGAQNQLLPAQPGGIPNFVCVAYPDANGRAYGGECRSGLVRFAWNYNVIWKGIPSGVEGRTGGTDFEPMAAVEYDTVLTPLGNNRYQLVVANASAIGSIDSFTWAAPPQLTITDVTSTSGGPTCGLTDGSISCQGKLAPPKCLCTGSGGSVTITFTATGAVPTIRNGVPIVQGLSWSYMHVTAMTPVPRLIPDVAQQVQKNNL
jgi:hypothetical protein